VKEVEAYSNLSVAYAMYIY